MFENELTPANASQRRTAQRLLEATRRDGPSKIKYHFPNDGIMTGKNGNHRFFRVRAVHEDGREWDYNIASCYGSYMGWF